MMRSNEISNVARQRRHSLDLTQVELADLAEVSERLIRDLESGRTTIGTDKLIAVLEALGLEIEINRTHGEN